MIGLNQFEENYRLDTEDGLNAFFDDYSKLAELRFDTTDFGLCDFLMDFETAADKVLTNRQRQIVDLCFLKDQRQTDVAKALGIAQQTVQEAVRDSIKKLVAYHVSEKERGE